MKWEKWASYQLNEIIAFLFVSCSSFHRKNKKEMPVNDKKKGI